MVCCRMLSSEMSSPLNEGHGLKAMCPEGMRCVLGHVLNPFHSFSLQLKKKKSAAPLLPKNRQKFWNLKQVSEAQFFHFLPWQGKEGYWQRFSISCKQLPRRHPSHPAWPWLYILSAAQRLSESRALIMLDSPGTGHTACAHRPCTHV